MKLTSITKNTLGAFVVASLLAAGYAWAEDDDGNRGNGRGGGGDKGSSRSSSDGENRSSRSDSGGGQRSNGGDQRSSGSVNRGREGSSRSENSSGSRNSSGERSIRSSNDNSGRSSKSLNEGSQPSREVARPPASGRRSSIGQSPTNSQTKSSLRTDQQKRERPTYSPTTPGSIRTDPSGNRSGAAQSGARDRASEVQNNALKQNAQQGQQYQTRRANEEQLNDFLQLRGENTQRQVDNVERQTRPADRGDLRDGLSVRGNNDDARRAEIARRLSTSNQPVDDDNNRRVGEVRGRGNRDGGREESRDYQQWRESAGRDRDDDHRDWSGRWREGDRFTSARNIRNDWRERDDDDYPFHGQWWGRRDQWHGNHTGRDWWGEYAHRHNRPYYWWTWATAPRLTSWVSFNGARPYYWDYGPGEYIYYDDGIVYVNGRWYQPAPEFYERTLQIVERAPELTPEAAAQLDWLPLGVFAVTLDGSTKAEVLVQLAVTKDGVISGTAFNQHSSAAYVIQGMVDKQTQRAVWSYDIEGKQRIVLETSINNLTQAEATGLVHYGANDLRVVQLVRLEEPGTGGAATTATRELPAPLPVQ